MDIQNIENHKAQLRKGALDFCILLVIGEGEAYTSDIIAELQEANLIVVEGTLYPLLSRLRSAGLLDYNWVESPSGPPRKYYRLTKDGQKTLDQLKENWKSFSQSINTLIKKHEKDSNN
jgi:PadR family transcriptional regulator, regulatory protein PadR